MSQINSATNLVPTPRFNREVRSLDDLGADEFLQFMVLQLQQQDPLNPVDNQELLDQINSIRDLTATTQLTGTLDSVLIGQNLATASGLIGQEIKAITDQGDDVAGRVSRVTVSPDPQDEDRREVRVHVGDKEVRLTNIREIVTATE